MVIFRPAEDKMFDIFKQYANRVNPIFVGTVTDGVFMIGDDELTADELIAIAKKLYLMNGQTHCDVCDKLATLKQKLPSHNVYGCACGHDVIVMRRQLG